MTSTPALPSPAYIITPRSSPDLTALGYDDADKSKILSNSVQRYIAPSRRHAKNKTLAHSPDLSDYDLGVSYLTGRSSVDSQLSTGAQRGSAAPPGLVRLSPRETLSGKQATDNGRSTTQQCGTLLNSGASGARFLSTQVSQGLVPSVNGSYSAADSTTLTAQSPKSSVESLPSAIWNPSTVFPVPTFPLTVDSTSVARGKTMPTMTPLETTIEPMQRDSKWSMTGLHRQWSIPSTISVVKSHPLTGVTGSSERPALTRTSSLPLTAGNHPSDAMHTRTPGTYDLVGKPKHHAIHPGDYHPPGLPKIAFQPGHSLVNCTGNAFVPNVTSLPCYRDAGPGMEPVMAMGSPNAYQTVSTWPFYSNLGHHPQPTCKCNMHYGYHGYPTGLTVTNHSRSTSFQHNRGPDLPMHPTLQNRNQAIVSGNNARHGSPVHYPTYSDYPVCFHADSGITRQMVIRDGEMQTTLRELYQSQKVKPGFGNFHSRTFTVLSWNISSSQSPRGGSSASSSSASLNSLTDTLPMANHREVILDQLGQIEADFLCLQEISSQDFTAHFEPRLAQRGYAGVFQHPVQGDAHKGLAIFYPPGRFNLAESYAIRYNEVTFTTRRAGSYHLVSSPHTCDTATRFAPFHNIALIGIFVNHRTHSRLRVVNTQLAQPEEYPDVRLLQGAILVDHLAHRHETKLSTIISGDFNSPSKSDIIRYLLAGRVSRLIFRHLDYGKYRAYPLKHPLRLRNAYHQSALAYIGLEDHRVAATDYLMYTTPTIRMLAFYDGIRTHAPREVSGSGHTQHLPLVALFEEKPTAPTFAT
ncbi:hypothetical protein IWQ61_002259 [Dispira simplex]|nr:hypothetical protein IWQ61_002259 [Dispira simplex]